MSVESRHGVEVSNGKGIGAVERNMRSEVLGYLGARAASTMAIAKSG